MRVLNILYSTAHHLIAHHLSGGQLSNYFSHDSTQRNKKTTSGGQLSDYFSHDSN